MAAIGGDAVELESYLSLDTSRAFVVIGSGAILAWAITRFIEPEVEDADHAPPGWYLMGVIVRPDMRRRGFGEQLTQARLRWLETRTDRVYYFTTADNHASRTLHESFGFRRVREGLTPRSLAFDGGSCTLFERLLR